MSCFSLLLLWHSILQTLSSCFDIRFSSWLRLFSKFWIDSGFSQSLLLMYCCSYHGTDLNQWYLLAEGWEMCNTISWNSYWLTWITNFHVKWCIRTQHYGHNCHMSVTNMPGWILLGTHLSSLFSCSSASVASVALILSYKIVQNNATSRCYLLSMPFALLWNWVRYVLVPFFTNAFIMNKILLKRINNFGSSVSLFVAASTYWK